MATLSVRVMAVGTPDRATLAGMVKATAGPETETGTPDLEPPDECFTSTPTKTSDREMVRIVVKTLLNLIC